MYPVFHLIFNNLQGTTHLWLNRDGSPGGTLHYRLVKSLSKYSVLQVIVIVT